MASEWDAAPLDALVNDILDRRGVTPLKLGSDFVAHGYRVISAKAIKGRRVDLSADEPRFVNEATYRKWMKTSLAADDVILTSEAPLGEPAYISNDIDWCLGQRLFGIRTKKARLHGRFLFYALQSEQVRHDLLSRATGTTAQGIRQTELRLVRIPLPHVDEQRAIAHILGTLDDKIELNRRMNETLEAMARALFKSWFVDFDPVRAKAEGRDPGVPQPLADLFPGRLVASELGEIPKGWAVGRLGDIAVHPRRASQPDSIEPDTPYIALEHMPKRCIALSDWGVAEGLESNKFQFKKGEILFGKLRPYFHKVGVAPVDGVCSTDIVVVVPREPHWFGFVLGMMSSDEFVEYTNAGSTGTKMPRTSWGDMARYDLVLPSDSVAEAFTKHVRASVERIIADIHESRTLAALRDALLPNLVSGELRVMDAERVIGRAS
jgi:type I restriction enzyme S subunit